MSNREVGSHTGTHLGAGEAYGTVVRKHYWHGLTLSELKHQGRMRLPKHSHDLGFFCLLLKGTYREHVGQKMISYRPFTMAFHSPGITHCDEIGNDGGHFFKVEVENHWLDRLREYGTVPETVQDVSGGDMVWLASRLLREFRAPEIHSNLVIEGMVLELLGLAARAGEVREKRAPAWLSQVVEALRTEFHHNLTVTQLAAQIGVHPVHLSRVFRQFHRQTVGDYLHRLRVQFACGHLCQADADLAEIALSAGFADQSHFTRVFKRITGVTPGVFRSTVTPRQSERNECGSGRRENLVRA